MSIPIGRRSILYYPHPMLRRKAEPVGEINEEVRRLASEMIALMKSADGIGLAAPQVGAPLRLFVCHVPASDGRSAESSPATALAGARVYINPRISDAAGDLDPADEGCLSLPEISGEVLRPPRVTIHATDLAGQEFTQTGAGLLARCWQHEVDHLDGVLIIDRFTQLSRLKNRAAIRDLERESGRR